MAYYVRHVREGLHDVYIGRSRGNPWCNPFHIGRDGTREEVIAKYRELVLRNPGTVARIKKYLRGKVLGCWCRPLACHGDVLAEIANG